MAGKPYILNASGWAYISDYMATFYPYRNDADNMYKVSVYCREIAAGTDTLLADLVYPSAGGVLMSANHVTGTLWARFEYVCPSDYVGILPYDIFRFTLLDDTGAGLHLPFHLPTILGTVGTTDLWFGTGWRTYTDNTYNTIACGTLSSGGSNFTEAATLKEYNGGSPGTLPTRTEFKYYRESFPVTWNQRVIRGKRPIEMVPAKDAITVTQIKSGTITDWLFDPKYRVGFNQSGDGQGFLDTNWHLRINSFGNLQKSIKTWTGETQVGNWTPEFVDENNELYGSFFGSSTPSESRFKEIQIEAGVWKYPLKWVSQLRGEVQGFEWEDGIARLDIVDKMKGLPDRRFVWDYANIGTTIGGKSYGKVIKVVGTSVMFEDKGDISWIERKRPGRSFLSSVFSGVIEGIVSGVVGGFLNPLAYGAGFAHGFLSAPPSSDKTVGGYYKIDDYNVIPDDLVKSGNKLKFYAGSIGGFATNMSHPLYGLREHTVSGGTFVSGLYGTVYLDDASGIKKNDWIYVRKPMFVSGSPIDCIEQILCGKNIDHPYRYGSIWVETSPIAGVPPITVYGTSDFSDSFVNEIQSTDLFYVSKIITDDENDSPFVEVKELLSELQISFFVDENNKFSSRSLRPRELVGGTSIATYAQGKNILDGFKFTRNSDEAICGVRYNYDYKGETGEGKNGYAKFIEFPVKSPLPGVTKWQEINSQWLRREDDVKCLAWRSVQFYQYGVDRISLPTTLFGVIHNVTDTINVTHKTGSLTNRLFEIDGYSKDFTTSRVTLEAFDIEAMFGRGNAKWTASSIDGTTSIQSGFSHTGIKGSPTYIGSLTARITAEDTEMNILTSVADDVWEGKYLVFGSSGSRACEIFSFSGLRASSGAAGAKTITGTRGLFSTIKKGYASLEKIYILADSTLDQNALGAYFQFGTSKDINSNIGTCYNFF